MNDPPPASPHPLRCMDAMPQGAFSNHSIVLHELKNPRSPGWQFAARRGSGPFQPFERECGRCDAMGWARTPSSAVASWKCCGTRGCMEPGRVAAVRGKRRNAHRTKRFG